MQIMKGDRTIRKCEDMDETVLQFAEFKAMAISDPRIKLKMEVDNEISRLTILKSAYHSSLGSLKRDIVNYYPKEIEKTERLIGKVTIDVETYNKNKPVEFQMVIADRVYTERAKATEHFSVLMKKLPMRTGETVDIGTYAGFKISIMRGLGFSSSVIINGARQYSVDIGDSMLGAITRMENQVNRLLILKDEEEKSVIDLKIQLENAQKEVEKPFTEEARLLELLRQKTELDLGLEFKQDGDSNICFEKDEGEEDEVLENTELFTEEFRKLSTEQRLYKLLYEYLSPFINEDCYYAKYKSEGFEDFVIESIGDGEYSIAHYYTKNGDAMRDPEITFIVDTENESLHPTSYLQDDMGVFYRTEDANKEKVDDLKMFMGQWFINIKNQGFELHKEKSFENEDERW